MSDATISSAFPFPLPESLRSYAELYQRSPEDAISRLENQFRKRGNDAVCCLLLAWFHRQSGNIEQASAYARKARAYAPGSRVTDFAPYFISRPDGFRTPIPSNPKMGMAPGFFAERTFSLEELIDRLSENEIPRITISEAPAVTPEDADLSISPFHENEAASETLANIHAAQGNTAKAITIYEILIGKYPEKEAEYREKMNRLKTAR